MIQRIQSIYLVLAALATAFVPALGSVASESNPSWLFPSVAILAVLVAAGAIGIALLYKHRELQHRFLIWLQYAVLVLLVLLFVGFMMGEQLDALLRLDPAAWIALVVPIAAYVLLYLARRAVSRDIELVRSMDRLR